jgi:hypothetical protein
MFAIKSLSLPPGTTATLNQTLPTQAANLQPIVGIGLGQNDQPGAGPSPDRAEYELVVSTIGTIKFRDTGDIHRTASWSVQFNDEYWFYEGIGQMSISVPASGKVVIAGAINTVSVWPIPVEGKFRVASEVGNKICAAVMSKRDMGENNPVLLALAADPMQVMVEHGLPGDLLATALPDVKNAFLSFLQNQANSELNVLRKRQVPRGFFSCWACRIGLGLATVLLGYAITVATAGLGGPVFGAVCAYVVTFLRVTAAAAETIVGGAVVAGKFVGTGGIGGLIEFICESIPGTC